jgi:hypothetical protein
VPKRSWPAEAVDREAERGDLRLDIGADGGGPPTMVTDVAPLVRSDCSAARSWRQAGLRGQQDRRAPDTGEEAGAESVRSAAVLAAGEDDVGDGGGGIEGRTVARRCRSGQHPRCARG